MKKPSWSNWRLQTILRCGEMYRLKFVENRREPNKLYFARGAAVGEVVQISHTRQMNAKAASAVDQRTLPILLAESLPTAEEARDLAADKFEQKVQEGGYILSDEDKEAGNDSFEKAKGAEKDATVDMAETYVVQVAPAINPVAVERKIVVEPKGVDFLLSGVIDLIEEQTPEVLEGKSGVVDVPIDKPREVIRDTKTKAKAPKATEADESGQLTMYAMLRRLETGELPGALALDHVVRTPGGAKTKPKNYVVRQYTTRDIEDIRTLYHRINVAIQAAEKEVYLPAPEGAWFCNAKWCFYHAANKGGCRYTRDNKTRKP